MTFRPFIHKKIDVQIFTHPRENEIILLSKNLIGIFKNKNTKDPRYEFTIFSCFDIDVSLLVHMLSNHFLL